MKGGIHINNYVIELNDLTYDEALNFAEQRYDFEAIKNATLFIDFNNKSHVEPFSMLLTSHVIRLISIECTKYNIDFRVKNHTSFSYAGHMGFLKSFGVDYGKKPNEAKGGSSYLPITKIDIQELKGISKSRRELIQETISRKSQHLASILGQGNYHLEVILSYAIREIMRNVVEHSESPCIYLAAQRWPNVGEVEIAIFDEGIGIPNAIKNNPNLQINNSIEAIMHSLKPGVSGKAFFIDGVLQNGTNSEWDNSGFGLYVTSELCKMGGEYTIISNDAAISYSSNKDIFKTYNPNIKGTGIRLKLNLNQIPTLSHEAIGSIISNGEAIAKNSEQMHITSASKMTRIIK